MMVDLTVVRHWATRTDVNGVPNDPLYVESERYEHPPWRGVRSEHIREILGRMIDEMEEWMVAQGIPAKHLYEFSYHKCIRTAAGPWWVRLGDGIQLELYDETDATFCMMRWPDA